MVCRPMEHHKSECSKNTVYQAQYQASAMSKGPFLHSLYLCVVFYDTSFRLDSPDTLMLMKTSCNAWLRKYTSITPQRHLSRTADIATSREKILKPQTPGLETWKNSPVILPWKTGPEVTLQRNCFGEDVPRPNDL